MNIKHDEKKIEEIDRLLDMLVATKDIHLQKSIIVKMKKYAEHMVQKENYIYLKSILHEIKSEVDNVTRQPKKPSDLKSYQLGFADCYGDIVKMLENKLFEMEPIIKAINREEV